MAERPLNIILVGKTGCGKSSTGNLIVGKEVFKSKGGFKSTTKEISVEEIVQDGRTIKVVDTPGLFDTEENLFETALKIQTSLKKVSPGPHAFLIVIHGSRKYTEEDIKTQHILQLTFGEKILKHALIVLTHEDEFDSSEEFLKEAKSVKELQTLIKLCGERCITLNSVRTDRDYIARKMKNIINEVNAISKNGNDCYTEDLTAYTAALKEHANKKTANENLTADLLATCLKNADDKAKKQVAAAYAKGQASATAKRQDEAASGVAMASLICTTMAKAAVATAGIVIIGGIGLGASAIARNPKPLVQAVQIVAEISAAVSEDKRKRDNQDMDLSKIDFESLNLRG